MLTYLIVCITNQCFKHLKYCFLPFCISVGQVPLAVAVGAKTCVRLAACQDLPAKQACARLLLCVAKWLPSLDPSQALPDAVQLLVDSHNPKDSATQLLDIAGKTNSIFIVKTKCALISF